MPLSTGKAINILRAARGQSLSTLAKNAGISTSFLSLVESDARSPSLTVLSKLASALEVPVDVLLLLGVKDGGLRTSDSSAKKVITLVEKLATLEDELANAIEES